jgi:hypothetical protein
MLERSTARETTSYMDTIWYYVLGELGAVQFMFMRPIALRRAEIIPLDLSVHARSPLYDEHSGMDNCEVLGGRCYYSGSYQMAREIATRFIAKPDPSRLWAELERYYGAIFL